MARIQDRVWELITVFLCLGLIATWWSGRLPAQDKAKAADPARDGGRNPGPLPTRFDDHLVWHSLLERNVVRAAPGMIIAFDGTAAEAQALARDGWVVCDGKTITDSLAHDRYKGKKSPNLLNRFLKGSDDPGKDVGNDTATTSEDGLHNHKLPSAWYHRAVGGGGASGLDTNAAAGGKVENGNPPVQQNGSHHHTVKLDPPSYTVVYLLYVRDPKGR